MCLRTSELPRTVFGVASRRSQRRISGVPPYIPKRDYHADAVEGRTGRSPSKSREGRPRPPGPMPQSFAVLRRHPPFGRKSQQSSVRRCRRSEVPELRLANRLSAAFLSIRSWASACLAIVYGAAVREVKMLNAIQPWLASRKQGQLTPTGPKEATVGESQEKFDWHLSGELQRMINP